MRLILSLIPVVFLLSSPSLALTRLNQDTMRHSSVAQPENEAGPPPFYTVMSLTPGIDSSRVDRYIDSGHITASSVVSQNQKILGFYSFRAVVIEFTTTGTTQVQAGTYRVACYTTYVNNATFTAFLSPYAPTTDIAVAQEELEMALQDLSINVPTTRVFARQIVAGPARRRLGVGDLDILGRGLNREGKRGE